MTGRVLKSQSVTRAAQRELRQGTRTLRLLRRTNLVLHLERLSRVDDVDDRAGPRRFEVLQECARVSAVRVGRIYALCREVV